MSSETINPVGTVVRHLLFGIAFGLAFPVLALGVEWARIGDRSATLAGMVSGNPVLAIVALTPLVLGVVFRLFGQARARLDIQLDKRRQLTNDLWTLAHRDSLTGLGSRHAFVTAMCEHLTKARAGAAMPGLCLVDLDRFKFINDTLGHHVGDALLSELAGRLSAALGPDQTAFRLGGDEFVVLDTAAGGDTARLGERLLDVFVRPFGIGEAQIVVGGSIGVAQGSAEDSSEMAALGRADLALYTAKRTLGNACVVYTEEMGHAAAHRMQLEADLRRGIEAGELFLEYQPIVGIKSGRVRSFEALVRWQHPTRGLVSPNDFIAIAEASGLIVPLGIHVLRTACRTAAGWPSPLAVSVNVSIEQFLQREFHDIVVAALAESGLPAGRLTLEITESMFTSDVDRVRRTIDGLRERGVRFALDDFGTGYSSLTHLREFQLDTLKLDQSFVTRLKSDAREAGIIRAVVDLGNQLRLCTTIEGVEDAEALSAMRELGLREAQGYHFARPMRAEAIAGYLAGTLAGSAAGREQAAAGGSHRVAAAA